MKMDSFTLAPMDTHTFGFNYYIGPKEFDRIQHVGESTGESMQFGFFGAISKLLLLMMNKFYAICHNYGVAIILLTILVRLVTAPLTQKQMRSMKGMSALQPKIKELQG